MRFINILCTVYAECHAWLCSDEARLSKPLRFSAASVRREGKPYFLGRGFEGRLVGKWTEAKESKGRRNRHPCLRGLDAAGDYAISNVLARKFTAFQIRVPGEALPSVYRPACVLCAIAGSNTESSEDVNSLPIRLTTCECVAAVH
jgi:hypothetical protein